MTESERIEKVKAGDTRAFATLYDVYVRHIYDFVYYKTHHKQTAEDITSETFIKALSKIQQFDNTRSFKAWLYVIARNTIIDHYRTSQREVVVEDIWDIESDEDIVRDADTAMKVKELSKHLKKLSPIQRDILTLRLWQELSYKEIADIVGKSEANCKVIYSRAIKTLKENISPALMALVLTLITH